MSTRVDARSGRYFKTERNPERAWKPTPDSGLYTTTLGRTQHPRLDQRGTLHWGSQGLTLQIGGWSDSSALVMKMRTGVQRANASTLRLGTAFPMTPSKPPNAMIASGCVALAKW